MSISQLIVDGFWQTMTGLVPLIVPVTGFLLVFKIFKELIFD